MNKTNKSTITTHYKELKQKNFAFGKCFLPGLYIIKSGFARRALYFTEDTQTYI